MNRKGKLILLGIIFLLFIGYKIRERIFFNGCPWAPQMLLGDIQVGLESENALMNNWHLSKVDYKIANKNYNNENYNNEDYNNEDYNNEDYNNEDYSHVRSAVNRAVNYLISRQASEGYWQGSFETDTSYTADYILLMHYLEMVEETRLKKAVNHLFEKQQDDGGWSAYPGGPSVLYISVIDYLALKVAGMSASDKRMAKAREFILANGGAESADLWIKMKLALFDQVPWTEMIPLNTDFLFYEDLIYRLGYMRTTLIPTTIIYENYYKVQLPEEHRT